jgi:hypothetical protein
VTPLLVANRVTRTEAAATLEHALAGPLRVRALARVATLTDATASPANVRTVVGGGPVFAGGEGWQLGLLASRLATRRPTAAGYAAPRTVDGLELGAYMERETLGSLPVRLVLDAGLGPQRVVEHGAPPDSAQWAPAGRVWGELAVPVGRLVEALVEVDVYRSRVAEAAASADWQSQSVRLGVRVRTR